MLGEGPIEGTLVGGTGLWGAISRGWVKIGGVSPRGDAPPVNLIAGRGRRRGGGGRTPLREFVIKWAMKGRLEDGEGETACPIVGGLDLFAKMGCHEGGDNFSLRFPAAIWLANRCRSWGGAFPLLPSYLGDNLCEEEKNREGLRLLGR